MTHVYGDSTPFPYDVDYIDLSRLAVDCAVQLMSAQHAIATSLERGETLGQERRAEVARINAMARSVESALEPYVKAGGAADRIGQRMLECVQDAGDFGIAADAPRRLVEPHSDVTANRPQHVSAVLAKRQLPRLGVAHSKLQRFSREPLNELTSHFYALVGR